MEQPREPRGVERHVFLMYAIDRAQGANTSPGVSKADEEGRKVPVPWPNERV